MAITENYVPGNVPANAPPALRNYLNNELNRIAESLRSPFLFLQPTYAPPKKPVNGMIAYADGTQWNPGAGEGAYIYQNGSWQLIDSAKGYGGLDIAGIPQAFAGTPVYQQINVFQRSLPINRPPYLCTPNVAANNITIDQGGLWDFRLGFSMFVPAAEILFLAIFIDGALAFETELSNTNQQDFESGELSGSGEFPAGSVLDIRLRSDSGDAPVTFNRLFTDLMQIRTPL